MTLNNRLKAAVAADIIDAETAGQLAVFLQEPVNAGTKPEAGQITGDEGADTEAVRFARGFHDVFLTIGIVILLTGIAFLSGGLLGAFVASVTAWALAEFYARRRKLVLPGIALAIGFVLCAGYLAMILLSVAEQSIAPPVAAADLADMNAGVTGALGALIASAVFFWRFGLPFAIGLIAASATAFTAAMLERMAPELFQTLARPLFLIAGLLIFTIAMRFDFSDRTRQTLAADKAFWLHLIAAPMIMHSAFGAAFFHKSAGNEFQFEPLLLIALIGILALVAIAIDRRAMLVAGLTYFGSALYSVIDATNIGEDPVMPLTILLLGAFVVVLGTNWATVRRFVLGNFVPASLANRLSPLTLRTPIQTP